MILIDGNNVTRRLLHTASAETIPNHMKKFDPSNPPTQTEMMEFRNVFIHFVVSEILDMKLQFQKKYGDVVIAFDSRDPWRKRIFPEYKFKRHNKEKSPEQKLEDGLFYWVMPILDSVLDLTNFTILKDLKVGDHGIEADDIIGVLAPMTPSVICSNDEDFTQLLSDTCRQYHSTRRKLLETPSKKDVYYWKMFNIISGQGKDEIPNILQKCKLSDEFIKWCKETKGLDITGDMIDLIEKDHRPLMKEYEDAMELEDDKLLEEGTRKRRRYLTAYEKPRGGDTLVKKMLEDLEGQLKINPRWKANYERNADLLLFERIPQDVREVILNAYHGYQKPPFFNTIALQSKLSELRLYNLEKRIGDF